MKATARFPAWLALTAFLIAGCAPPAAKLAQVSGKVTFKGKPVPAGYISFMPDATKGNRGEVRVVQIKDGAFDSALERNPGIYPGANVLSIAGFDGHPQKGFSQGKQLFNPYELRETLADGVSTRDFTVPPAAAENLQIMPTSDEP